MPVSERGKNPVEIILLKEWYVRQTHIQDRMKELIEEITFHPVRNRQFLLDWMDNISIDWPISRRRWYHTNSNLYSADEKYVIVPPSGTMFSLGENTPSGSRVLDRETRQDVGSFEDMSDELGEITGEEKV